MSSINNMRIGTNRRKRLKSYCLSILGRRRFWAMRFRSWPRIWTRWNIRRNNELSTLQVLMNHIHPISWRQWLNRITFKHWMIDSRSFPVWWSSMNHNSSIFYDIYIWVVYWTQSCRRIKLDNSWSPRTWRKTPSRRANPTRRVKNFIVYKVWAMS